VTAATPSGSGRSVAIGGIWLGFFFHQLMRRPLIPVNDPYMAEALEHE